MAAPNAPLVEVRAHHSTEGNEQQEAGGQVSRVLEEVVEQVGYGGWVGRFRFQLKQLCAPQGPKAPPT